MASPASADPVTLRVAGIAPEGTSWARELRAFAREVEVGTQGRVRVKLYLGGVAGDDVEMGERLRRGQLDGAASAGMLCQRVMPSMRVLRMRGLFQSRDEALHVVNALGPTLRGEARAAGLEMMAFAVLGVDVPFLSKPVSSLAELSKLRLWQWDLDPVGIGSTRAFGLKVVPLPVGDAGRALEDGRIDGFVAIPSAILGFQWHVRAHYLVDLPLGLLPGCLLMRQASFDAVPEAERSVLRAAAAKLGMRFTEITQQQDDALIGGVFLRAGVKPVVPDARFRNEILAATRAVRDKLIDEGLVSRDLVSRVQALLADHRAAHPLR
jgi:TRAP-type C4-dicarboxylate transport system substrate-binding protein